MDFAIKVENDITGDVLIRADDCMLLELEIPSETQRNQLLNIIYGLKLVQEIPFEEGDFIPEGID